MLVSVVINTYNRGESLRHCLRALEYQTYEAFEVIVVNGPSTDRTEEVLREYAGRIRVTECPEANLNRSRNIAIAEASGELVAFIDDDSVALPGWLTELVAGFAIEDVAAAGGIVYDHTGYTLQCYYNSCDRRARVPGNLGWAALGEGSWFSETFPYTIGTNSCYRRSGLVEVNGFDEQYEIYLDETDLCYRLTARGYRVAQLGGAPVIHRFLPSDLRSENRVLRKPFVVVKNTVYFALKARRADESADEVLTDCRMIADELLAGARFHATVGNLTPAELKVFESEVSEGFRCGTERGLHSPRRTVTLPAARPEAFRQFPTRRPVRRLSVCFVSQGIPPAGGGVARFTWDLAVGFAAEGHEVHLVTDSPNHNRVDYEEGVWVHRLSPVSDARWSDLPPTVQKNLNRSTAIHREIIRISTTGRLDLISVPVWDFEGLHCLLDPGLTCVLTLQTTIRIFAEVNAISADSPLWSTLLGIEDASIRAARHIHAISSAILRKVERDSGPFREACNTAVIPLGVTDRSGRYARARRDPGVRILSVGRLEVRKGTDVFLAAAVRLARIYPAVEFVLVGDDSIPCPDGSTYRARFEQQAANHPVAGRVRFEGVVSEAALYQYYADCDVFCLPARYESFGLVFLEAMSFGKPVVGCNVGGMPEIIEPGGNGFLVKPGDVDDLVEHLGRLIANEALRREFGARSRERYERLFSSEIMVRNTIAAYTTIAAQPSAYGGRLTVSLIHGAVFHRDAMSNVVRAQLDAIEAHGRRLGIMVVCKLYVTHSDIEDPRIVVTDQIDRVVTDRHFLASDIILFNFGIYYPLFDAIRSAPRAAHTVVLYYGVTPLTLVPEDHRPAIVNSTRQLVNILAADRLLVTSRFLLGELTAMGIAHPSATRIGLPVARRPRSGSPEPGKGGPLRLLYVGRFVPSKGVLDLVKAVRESRANGLSFQLQLVGALRFSDSAYLAGLRQLIDESGLSRRVSFHTDVTDEELADLLATANALVIPSYHEGFCVPVIEAYHSRCFVICSDAGSLPETAGGFGRTYRAGDVAGLCERLAEFAAAQARGGVVTDRGFVSSEEWRKRVEAYAAGFLPNAWAEQFCAILLSGVTPGQTRVRSGLLL